MTADIFDDAERRMKKAVEALRLDLAAIRTGRASSALVERIQVDYYGAPTPINQVAQISVPEARLIVIQPYERRLLADIEKAIQKSDLGVNPNNDGQVIRLNIPPLNEERRRDMVKISTRSWMSTKLPCVIFVAILRINYKIVKRRRKSPRTS